jgi:hypothetical protein
MASKQLTDYQAARAVVVQRLAKTEGTSDELRALATRLVAVCDAQAGLPGGGDLSLRSDAPAGYVAQLGSFDEVLRRAGTLSSIEWGSIAIPSELYRLATLAGA